MTRSWARAQGHPKIQQDLMNAGTSQKGAAQTIDEHSKAISRKRADETAYG
jgi:hypothetical protein